MWILLSLVAAAGMLLLALGIWVHRFRKTAFVVVHPWNFGRTEAERQATLQRLPMSIRVAAEQQAQFVEKHVEYYQRLESGLPWANARWVVVLDEPQALERSTILVHELTAIPGPLRTVEQFGRLRAVMPIETRPGRATPTEATWDELFKTMHEAGIRRLIVVGSYLGLREGSLVAPEDTYFCINDFIRQAQAFNRFQFVGAKQELCYIHEVPPGPGLSARPARRANQSKQNRGKKRRKR